MRVNPAGGEILALCDGSRSAEQIARLLGERHAEEPNVEEDVHEFLANMARLGVIETPPS